MYVLGEVAPRRQVDGGIRDGGFRRPLIALAAVMFVVVAALLACDLAGYEPTCGTQTDQPS